MLHRRIVTVPAGLALVALALTGCGNSSTSTDTASGSKSADTGSTATSTPSPAALDLTSANFGQTIQDAQKQAGSYRFTMEIKVAGVAMKGNGEVALGGDQPLAHVTLGTGPSSIESIAAEGVIYLKAPMLKSDKPWLKIDPEAKTGVGSMMGALGANQDPAAMLSTFAKASRVTKGAAEEIGGAEATKYAVTIASADMAAAMKMDPKVAAALPKTFVYDVWVNDENLPVKLSSTQQVAGQESTTTMEFSDYGAEVSVQAPPASQVTTKEPDMGAMMGG